MILLRYQCSPKIMEIHVKFQAAVFVDIERLILKFIQKKERNLGAKKEKIKKKNTIGHSHFPISKLTTKLQLPRQCGTARHIDWWSRIENSDTSLYIDAQLVFDKGTYKGPDSIIFYFKSIISVFFLFMFCLFSPSANMPVQNPPCFYSNNKNL